MRTVLASAVATCLLGLSACGGDSSPDTLIKSDLDKQANAICAKYTAKVSKLNASAATLNDPAKAATFFTDAADLASKQQSELAALKPDSSIKDDYQALLSELAKGQQLLSDLHGAAAAKDATKGQQLFGQVDAVDKNVNAAAAKVGADKCGSAS